MKDVRFELDMLQGNLNRMCITEDKKELEKMKQWSLERVEKIYEINIERFDK